MNAVFLTAGTFLLTWIQHSSNYGCWLWAAPVSALLTWQQLPKLPWRTQTRDLCNVHPCTHGYSHIHRWLLPTSPSTVLHSLCRSSVMLSPGQLNLPEIQTVLLEWPLKNRQSISRRLVIFMKNEVMWDSEKEEYSTRSFKFLEYSKMQGFSWINNRNW